MNDEETWFNSLDEENMPVSQKYDYMMRPEPFEDLGAIEVIDDPYLGKGIKTRTMSVGMVRNAKQEDKKSVQVYLKPFPHLRIKNAKQLQGWYKAVHEPPNVRPRPCFTEAILTEPYGGYCRVGCKFCYINSGVRGYRGTGLITVPIDYGAQIEEQLNKMKRSAAGYFSSFTDPFMELEEFYHNTQYAAEAFVNEGLPIFFLSRLPYPDWAIDLILQNKYSYAQKSINTPDPDDWKKLSPGAMPLEEHLDEINKLHKLGIYVSIQCNPIIAGITSHAQVLELFTRLKKAGADHVIIKFVEAGYSWAPEMVERITKQFGPERGAKFENLFTENIGGQRTITEKYRMQGHKMYQKHATSLGLTYATCYEYKYQRGDDGQILSKTGVSIGRDYTTADQCHGHRVPMFTREDTNEQFTELEECPPTGCMYCAAENEGAPRCGDELAGEGKALRLVDLKVSITDASK